MLSELLQLNLDFLCGFADHFLPILTGCELRLIQPQLNLHNPQNNKQFVVAGLINNEP